MPSLLIGLLGFAVGLPVPQAAIPDRGPDLGSSSGGGDAPVTGPVDPGDSLVPDTAILLPGGPNILILRTPGSAVAALRLSIPLRDEPGKEGVARVLQELALERVRPLARSSGVRVEGVLGSSGLSYTVSGADEDLDYLAYLLRELLAEPPQDPVRFERAKMVAREEAVRLQETAKGRMVALLRNRVEPTRAPLQGTPAAVAALVPEDLQAFWHQSHRQEDMKLIVAVDAEPVVLFSAVQELGAQGPLKERPRPRRASSTPEGQVEVLREWIGEARVLPDRVDPHGEVTALLVTDRLREQTSAGQETHVQLLELRRGRALAVFGAAYPNQSAALRRTVHGALSATADGLTAGAVEAAVARIKRHLLLHAGTPSGLVEVVGRFYDATGEEDGARSFVDALEDVGVSSTRAFLQRLGRQTPLRAEVRP